MISSRPNKFQVVKINNVLFDYECQRLIRLYNEENVDFIKGFYGFDVEYINNRLEDVMYELTGYQIINQEPIYITKSAPTDHEKNRSDAWSDDNPIVEKYGNRVFTLLVFLSDGDLFFPQINLRHKAKVGDGIIWNNVDQNGRLLQSINKISNNTHYLKKWVREKPFIYESKS